MIPPRSATFYGARPRSLDQAGLCTARPAEGFSLVEVTIALGLISVAVISILALLPAGLVSLRSSMDRTIEAQILRSVSARAVVANFANLQTDEIFFDEQGQPVRSRASARYVVSLSTNDVRFPGSTNVTDWSQAARRLRVQIVMKPTPQAPGTTNVHTLFVANSGK